MSWTDCTIAATPEDGRHLTFSALVGALRVSVADAGRAFPFIVCTEADGVRSADDPREPITLEAFLRLRANDVSGAEYDIDRDEFDAIEAFRKIIFRT